MRARALCSAGLAGVLAAGLAVGALAACGRTGVTPGDPRVALAGLPPRKDPPVALDDDEDRERAVKEFFTLAPGDPARPAARDALVRALAVELDEALTAGATGDAVKALRTALELWDPTELAAAPVGFEPLADGTARLYAAVSREGRKGEAVLAMAALRAARPAEAARMDADFAAFTDYLTTIETTPIEGPGGGPGPDEAEISQRANRYLEGVLPSFGSPWVARTLAEIVVRRQDDVVKTLSKPNGAGAEGKVLVLRYGTTVLRGPATIVQAYALAGLLEEAPRLLDRVPTGPFDDEELRERLTAALAKDAPPRAWMALVATILRKDGPQRVKALTAYRMCEHAARTRGTSPEIQVCLGVTAVELERTGAAIRHFEDARRLDPANPMVGEQLVSLYGRRIRELVAAERIDAARARLGELETFVGEVRRKQPTVAPKALGEATAVVALGHYNAGLIAEAERLYARAATQGARASAVEQLGQIAFRRGHFEVAARLFDQAAAMPRTSPIEQTYDGARLLQLAGDAYAGAGQPVEARKRWERALKAWDDLYQAAVLRAAPIGLGADDLEGKWAARLKQLDRDDGDKRQLELIFEMLGESFLGKARAEGALGRTEASLRAVERAVDADSSEAATYANAISFLLLGGHYDAALDAYHRALGRRETTEYFKIYTSLWILEFGGMKGRPQDPLALEYLAGRDGKRWYHTLARWRTGKLDDDGLVRAADTSGERCEAYFYLGLRAAAKGDGDRATDRFRLTLATDMLGFFEYEMARALLTKGLPK